MIEYRIGDATKPDVEGNVIIAHCCNDIGAWGSGFVMSLSQSWDEPEECYRLWSKSSAPIGFQTTPFRLGRMQFVDVAEDIWVANMIAQEGVGWNNGIPPVRYDALEDCLAELVLHARALDATVCLPRICCGLAGGTWDKVEPLIEKHLPDIRVVVYDLEEVK